jgi:hypothetical protein
LECGIIRIPIQLNFPGFPTTNGQKGMNASEIDWSPTENKLLIKKLGQPSENEVILFNIPEEHLQFIKLT